MTTVDDRADARTLTAELRALLDEQRRRFEEQLRTLATAARHPEGRR
jgi:hypothetical protein